MTKQIKNKKQKQQVIQGFKGFDKELKCRDFQFEIGGKYEHIGTVKACATGFHFCENPLDIFGYYPPSNSRYCEVEGYGDVSKEEGGNSKVAVRHLSVGIEVGLKGVIEGGLKFILSKIDWNNNKESNTGYQSVATNTGDKSVSINTGSYSVSTVEGKESIAIVTDYKSKAKGALDCWIVLTERNYYHEISHVQAFKVDGEKVKADTFYMLEEGKLKEVK